jgi:hypothetical protein
MTTVGEAAAERIGDIETILLLMEKNDWTRLTITEDGFSLSGEDIGATLVIGVLRENAP